MNPASVYKFPLRSVAGLLACWLALVSSGYRSGYELRPIRGCLSVCLFVCLFVVYLFVPPSMVCHHAEVLPAFQPREGLSLLQLHPANISANVANCSSKNSADPGQKQSNQT
ncbi:hypothetical protein CRENBAI_003079 [Crenichthys baileyi]|uniref:Uncharacterized protein n=1 Tax=Crenichthys baileyi TaxID=28760 RepID=A0AAV9RP01_9TELE